MLAVRHNLAITLMIGFACASQPRPIEVGNQLASAGKVEEASAAYFRAIEETPEDAAKAHLGLATLYLRTGRLPEAEQAIAHSRNIEESRPALVTLAELRRIQKRYLDGEELLNQAIALVPKEQKAPELYYHRGLIQSDAVHVDDAIVSFKKALELGSRRVDASVRLARLLTSLRQFDDAIAVLNKAIKKKRSNARLRAVLGEVHKASGMFDYSENSYREALKRDPKNIEAAVGLASILRKKRKHAEAIELLSAQLRGREDNVDLLLELGASYRAYLLKDQSIEAYRSAVEADPARPEAYKELLGMLEGIARSELLRKAAEALPGDLEIQVMYGDEACKRRLSRRCVETMERILEKDPRNVEAHFRLGKAAANKRKMEKAGEHLEALARLDGDKASELMAAIEEEQSAAPPPPKAKKKKKKKKKKRKKRRRKKKK